VLRAITLKAEREYGDEVFGFLDGWRGVIESDYEMLTVDRLRGTLPRGGTILGTSRVTPYMDPDGIERTKATIKELGIDALIVIGGEGTLSCGLQIHTYDVVPVVGIPKTIDNDIGGTELTFGFDTAVNIATEAIDRLHTTAESHDRVMVVEVMGRHVGHIALWAGIAGGATMTLIPEEPFDIAAVAQAVSMRHKLGKFSSIIVVAEGAQPIPGTIELADYSVDQFGHQRLGGIGSVVAAELEARTGYETRVTVLGHVQRGGTPSAFDRVLCTWFGTEAIDAVHEGNFGSMVALQCGEVVQIELADAVRELKTVNPKLYEVAKAFFP